MTTLKDRSFSPFAEWFGGKDGFDRGITFHQMMMEDFFRWGIIALGIAVLVVVVKR